uniref:Retrotransposon Copia-like N-terminal domain-containing protein n=1 Tax=Manihot esculenta TaxID=3983 RepID=A0A2C9U1F4_MANES
MAESSSARALSNSAPTISKTIVDDALMLQKSDNLAMLLVSVQLNGINYRGQNRAMKIALNAKNKLAFVEGKIDVPKDGYEEYEKWRRCNYMVTSWILNSISKDLVGSFLYLGERYGESNGPMVYQIKRRIASISQDNLSMTTYYGKLKQLWDELANIVPILACICGSEKLTTEIHNANHLMQFLMGLNDTFDQVRSQVLLLDPLPTVNKAFSMVLQVESRKEVQTNLTEHTEIAALAVRSQGNRRDYRSTTQGRTTVTTII